MFQTWCLHHFEKKIFATYYFEKKHLRYFRDLGIIRDLDFDRISSFEPRSESLTGAVQPQSARRLPPRELARWSEALGGVVSLRTSRATIAERGLCSLCVIWLEMRSTRKKTFFVLRQNLTILWHFLQSHSDNFDS